MTNKGVGTAKGLAVGVAAALVNFAFPAGAFNVDGILTTADEYNCALCYKYTIDHKVTNVGYGSSSEMHDGMLKIGREVGTGNVNDSSTYNGNVFMLFTAPLAIVDNVYQPSGDGPPKGWSTATGNPYDVTHKFSNLEIEDALEFKIKDKWGDKNLTRVGYIKASTEQAQIETDSRGDIVNVATSLEYNLAAGHGDQSYSPDPDAPPAGWVKEVMYEYELNGDIFDDGMVGIASFSHSWFNAYTNKLKGDSWMDMWCMYDPHDSSDCNPMHMPGDPPDDPPTAMSEPGTGAMFLAGIGLVSLYRRRLAKK